MANWYGMDWSRTSVLYWKQPVNGESHVYVLYIHLPICVYIDTYMFVYTCTVFSFWGNGFSPKMFPHTNLLRNNNTSISFIDQQGDFAEDSLTNHGPTLEDPRASRGDYEVDTPTSLKYVCCLTSNKRKCQGKFKKGIEYWPKSRIYVQ